MWFRNWATLPALMHNFAYAQSRDVFGSDTPRDASPALYGGDKAKPSALKWNAAVRLLVAALVGAVLGIAAGYSVQLLLWAVVGAVVVGGAVYYYRAFRLNAFPRLGPTPCASYRLLAM